MSLAAVAVRNQRRRAAQQQQLTDDVLTQNLSASFILLLSPYFYQYIERGARQLMGDEGSYLHK